MGRKPIGDMPMSNAERQRRYRNLRANKPKSFEATLRKAILRSLALLDELCDPERVDTMLEELRTLRKVDRYRGETHCVNRQWLHQDVETYSTSEELQAERAEVLKRLQAFCANFERPTAD